MLGTCSMPSAADDTDSDPVARWMTVRVVEVTWLDHDGEQQLLRSRAPFRCKVPAWVFRDDPQEEE